MINDNDHLKVTLRTKDLISFYKTAESLLQAIVKSFYMFLKKAIMIIAVNEKMFCATSFHLYICTIIRGINLDEKHK